MTSSISHSFSLHDSLVIASEKAEALLQTYASLHPISKLALKEFKQEVSSLKKNLKTLKTSQLYTLSVSTCYFKKFVDQHALTVEALENMEKSFQIKK